MPPAYIHLRCEIIGRFVQAYVPCTTAVFIPPSHPPRAYIQNYRHRIWYRYSLILFFWMTGRRQGTATDTRVAPVAESTQTLPPLPAPLPAKGNVAANMPKAPSDPLPENDLDTNNGTINDTLPESIPSVPNDAATPNMSAQAQMPTATASTQNAATTAASSQPTPIPGKCHHLTIQSKRRHVAITVLSRCEYWWMPKVLPVVWKWLKVAARMTWIMLHCKRYATGASNQRVTATISRYRGALKSHSSSMSGSNLTTLLVNATWQGITC